jgi:hypothetical protein
VTVVHLLHKYDDYTQQTATGGYMHTLTNEPFYLSTALGTGTYCERSSVQSVRVFEFP